MTKVSIQNLSELKQKIDEICDAFNTLRFSEESIFKCRLVCYELASNVLKHGEGIAKIKIVVSENSLCIRVSGDNNFELPECNETPNILGEHGRGIYIVRALADGKVKTIGNDILVTLPMEYV